MKPTKRQIILTTLPVFLYQIDKFPVKWCQLTLLIYIKISYNSLIKTLNCLKHANYNKLNIELFKFLMFESLLGKTLKGL